MEDLDPAVIARLRENSGIRLDGEGRFWHQGAAVEHPGVVRAFHRGLGRAPDGRPTLTFGRTWYYIDADGPLYQAPRAVWEGDGERLARCVLTLDDGSEEVVALQPGNVVLDADGALRMRVKGGREWARLAPSAQRGLGHFVVETGEGPALRTGGQDLLLGGA